MSLGNCIKIRISIHVFIFLLSNVCFFDFVKVLHLNTFSEGGAALCVIRIDKALVQQGIDSRMLFA